MRRREANPAPQRGLVQGKEEEEEEAGSCVHAMQRLSAGATSTTAKRSRMTLLRK